ncbi:MAG: hypothetical protein P8X85_25710 [Desulfobacterales bacterium]
MSETSELNKLQTFNNYSEKPNDEGSPHTQKIKSGIFFKLTMGLGIFSIICTLAMPNPIDQTKNEIKKIAVASLDEINARKLATILDNQSINFRNQEDVLEKEIQGKIVEWEVEILVVASLSDHYKILTKASSIYPGALLTLYPQNIQQETYIDSVNPGTSIKVKGKISGVLQRRIQINPALIIEPTIKSDFVKL